TSSPATSATTTGLNLIDAVRKLVQRLSEPSSSSSNATSNLSVNGTAPELQIKKGGGGGGGGGHGGGGGRFAGGRSGNGAAAGAGAHGSGARRATNLQKATRDFSFLLVFLAVALMFT
ncbi:hypothetical protein LTS18_003120, partial [Coniosporium uncinatum]